MIEQLDDHLIKAAIERAGRWQRRANQQRTRAERRQLKQLAKMLDTPVDKVVLVKLLDQSLRSQTPRRTADQIKYIIDTFGIPSFFSSLEKGLIHLFCSLGRYLAPWSVPKVIDAMQRRSRHMILPGETEALHAYLDQCRQQQVQVNVNHIGEAVLGEAEAKRRLEAYVAALKDPLIEQISVKISSLYSQAAPIAFDHDVALLGQRLEVLYATAMAHAFTRADGRRVAKTIHLDMESYADVAITLVAFQRTLDLPEFKNAQAGIVLQAYLPEAHALQQGLTQWARARTAAGGHPIRLRIVKGANLEMERIEAALTGWPLATYDTKPDVDANFKRMLVYGLMPENIHSVRLGVASHNLFELALAHEIAQANGVEASMTGEMLAGMADHIRRTLGHKGLSLLLYAPVAKAPDFLNAIAYLIRRMDENTAPGNYLRYAPRLKPHSPAWEQLAQAFRDSCQRVHALNDRPHRIQSRMSERDIVRLDHLAGNRFLNVSDTDWTVAANRQWAEQIRSRWQTDVPRAPMLIAPVVVGRALENEHERFKNEIIDLNRLPERVCIGHYTQAAAADVDQAVSTARQDPDGWRSLSLAQRHTVLKGVAQELARARGALMGAAAAETGKIFIQSDPEVSEAIDFVHYYPFAMQRFDGCANLNIQGKGVGVVVSPWNFPIAIPCGGIAAALAAGNTVILKPASAAVLTAWQLCQCFWRGGVSKNTLQFLPCPGELAGQSLIAHPQVDFVILTGGTATAQAMLRTRPDLFLCAETGGKNSTIVTAMADREQAIKHVVQSAFGHGGQKCSATSLLVLEKEVYDDPHFKQTLVDATQSLAVGSAWQFETRMGPLIQPPQGDLLKGLTQLDPGEAWALQPKAIDNNPYLWTPGIKWGVQPGSFTHMTELFGPVLGVMCADTLSHAIELSNQTGYGLTAGLESLDPREIAEWQARIYAGNLYINRGTTGAIVLRQPFGGWGKSAIGPAIKAGGPNYVSQLIEVKELAPPPEGEIPKAHPLLDLARHWQRKCIWEQMGARHDEMMRVVQAIFSYLHHAQTFFASPHDPFHLRGEDNQLCYRPIGKVAVCVHPQDSLFETAARIAAGRIVGCDLVLSLPEEVTNEAIAYLLDPVCAPLLDGVTVVRHKEKKQVALVSEVHRLRYAAAGRVPKSIYQAASAANIHVAAAPVLMDGRLELLHYYLNQTISHAYHRAGNLGERGAAL